MRTAPERLLGRLGHHHVPALRNFLEHGTGDGKTQFPTGPRRCHAIVRTADHPGRHRDSRGGNRPLFVGIAEGKSRMKRPGRGTRQQTECTAGHPHPGIAPASQSRGGGVPPFRHHRRRCSRALGGCLEEIRVHGHCRRRPEQGQGADPVRMPAGAFKRHQSAHAVAGHAGDAGPEFRQHGHRPVGEIGDRRRGRPLASTVAGKIGRADRVAMMGEPPRRKTPHAVVHARSVQEDNRRHVGLERPSAVRQVDRPSGDPNPHARVAASSPRLRSACRSSMCSRPTDKRTSPSSTPASRSPTSSSCACVVLAG